MGSFLILSAAEFLRQRHKLNLPSGEHAIVPLKCEHACDDTALFLPPMPIGLVNCNVVSELFADAQHEYIRDGLDPEYFWAIDKIFM